jgi:hypothetical protein
MPKVPLEITRRTFLKSGVAAGVAGAVGPTGDARRTGLRCRDRRGCVVPPGRGADHLQRLRHVSVALWVGGAVGQRGRPQGRREPEGSQEPGDALSEGAGCGLLPCTTRTGFRRPWSGPVSAARGRFREVEWDFALDLIAQKMNQIKERSGQESVAFFGHTAGDKWWIEHVAQAWGSPNAGEPPSTSLCISPRDEASTADLRVPRRWPGAPRLGPTGVSVALIGSHIGEDARNTVMQDFAEAPWTRRHRDRRGSPLLHAWRPSRTTGCRSSPAPTQRCCWPGCTC